MEERIRNLELHVAALMEGLRFTRGKALGLEAALLTLARQWGNEPQAVIEALFQTSETLENQQPGQDMPSDTEKEEVLRVLEQVSSVLHSRNL